MTPAPVRVSYAIMHHPARPELLERLVSDLRSMGVDPEVVVDPEPYSETNPWRCARAAWEATPEDCTHRLVLQDDAIPCDDFPAGVQAALEHQPAHPVSFFVNWLGHQCGRAQMEACERCLSWAWLPMNGWYPTVATALPRSMALELAAWPTRKSAIADDAVLAQWANHNHVRVLQTVPSLVQHDEHAISTITGHNRQNAQVRSACCFLADDTPDVIDWTRGPRA